MRPDLEPIELLALEGSGILVLRFQEMTRERLPSLNFSAALSKRGFAGTHPSVWVLGTALRAFGSALAEFDRTRQGEAALSAMSPGEFELRLWTEDASGHLLVSATVANSQIIGFQSRRLSDSVTLHFELDPSDLPGIVAGFQGWAALDAAG